jgi:hypothetical protein
MHQYKVGSLDLNKLNINKKISQYNNLSDDDDDNDDNA